MSIPLKEKIYPVLTKYFYFGIINTTIEIKGEWKMKETNIKLTNIQDIREFVNQVILLEYEVDLVQGRYVIDAKSIMGIFSLDLLSPIKVVAHCDCAADFFEKIDRFVCK